MVSCHVYFHATRNEQGRTQQVTRLWSTYVSGKRNEFFMRGSIGSVVGNTCYHIYFSTSKAPVGTVDIDPGVNITNRVEFTPHLLFLMEWPGFTRKIGRPQRGHAFQISILQDSGMHNRGGFIPRTAIIHKGQLIQRLNVNLGPLI